MSSYSSSRTSEERTLKDITPNVAGLLCYVGGWISGIIFLVLEQKNRFVRFHALQSIIVFGILCLAGAIFGRIPFAGPWFGGIIGITGFIFWIILMIKAVNGEYFKLPWAGELADKLTSEAFGPNVESVYPPPPEAKNTEAEGITQPVPVVPNQSTPLHDRVARTKEFRAKYYTSTKKSGRIVGSAVAIAWSIALLVFFTVYSQYIAFYEKVGMDWQRHTLLTSDYDKWLPVLAVALAVSIIGNVLAIIYDRYLLRQSLGIILDSLGVVVVVTLLRIFPFDFTPLPNIWVMDGIQVGLTITLVLMAVGFGISAMVKFIQLIVNLAQERY